MLLRSAVLAALSATCLIATETENLGLRLLPAPKPPAIDGTAAGWDLSGGIFACGDVENQRSEFATWIFGMYDADNLYLLAHFVDPTPMNNPGQVEGDYGFNGDCLQFRVVAGAGLDIDKGRGSHWTCWRGRDGKHVMDVEYGVKFDKGRLKDAQAKGAKQAFAADKDGKGYLQALAIPWGLLGPEGWKPKAGDSIRLTFEPNFTVGTNGRLTNKDLFLPEVQPDRVFTFMASRCWGAAELAKAGAVEPAPVRLSDRREFTVALSGGQPAVDWSGLIKPREIPGFKPIAFEMPFDGYISLNLFAADGSVARQLLNADFFTKGRHKVKWDGLTTFSWRNPGDPVAPGTYTWQALVHPGLDLKLVGWAANAGAAPWDGPSGKDNWGGDHGEPNAVAVAGDRVYLGWTFAEAGKALVACDLDGKVQWKNSRQGMSGCGQVAVDGGLLFGLNETYIYRLKAGDGSYAAWPGRDSPDLRPHDVLDEAQRAGVANDFALIAAKGGTLWATVAKGGPLLAIDAQSGKLKQRISIAAPAALCALDGDACLVASEGRILRVDLAGGAKPFAALAEVGGIAVDRTGQVFAAVDGEINQVVVLGADGKELRRIGRPGGRPALGAWDPNGLRNPHGLAIDAKGVLWVAENDKWPKRFSAWDAASGAFKAEYFGPTTYGALGGGISPADPLLMVGQGCAWRLDPKTGRARALAVITRDGMENSRFATGANGRTYLLTAGNWAFDVGPIQVFEQVSDTAWPQRGAIYHVDKDGNELARNENNRKYPAARTMLWADANGDGKRDPGEISGGDGKQVFSGWYMGCTPDLALYAGKNRFACTGFTACGAPTWDFAKPQAMPGSGLGAADGRFVLQGGEYGQAHTRLTCFDLASGRQVWWYPDNFNGVHGSHNAPPPVQGMIRGSYGPCAAVRLPDPIGDAWIIATNVGEWHILTERGFYLSRLFQGDQIKVRFPELATPGAPMNDTPCGMGGEDFGGSAIVAKDGKLHLQAGKTGFWNLTVENLDRVALLPGGSVSIAEADVAQARKFQEQARQANVGIQRLAAKKASPAFTGDLAKDFAGAQIVAYEKGDGTRTRSAMAWDDANLYAAWEVQDRTPWINGATKDDCLYWGGDTVDLQLQTDPAADPARGEAVRGDLRLSIGPMAGKDTAVIFRRLADDKAGRKAPRTFSSGVVKAYEMESVLPLAGATIRVAKRGDGYTVEAAIPLAELGFAAKPGLKLRGDLGVTFGGQSGDRTRLRSYWSNQATGIVDDVVFELKPEPKNWGEISFAE